MQAFTPCSRLAALLVAAELLLLLSHRVGALRPVSLEDQSLSNSTEKPPPRTSTDLPDSFWSEAYPSSRTHFESDISSPDRRHIVYEGRCMYLATAEAPLLTVNPPQDGQLLDYGEQQVEDRLILLRAKSINEFRFLLDVEKVFVAPTKAAMGTAVIAIARAWSWHDRENPKPFPTFEVLPALQPFAPFAYDPRDQVHDYINTLFTSWFSRLRRYFPHDDKDHTVTKRLRSLMRQLLDSYDEKFLGMKPPEPVESGVTARWLRERDELRDLDGIEDSKTIARAAGNAKQIFDNIHIIKDRLASVRKKSSEKYDSAEKVLMVGDKLLGSWLFMAGLPKRRRGLLPGHEGELPRVNLQTAMRRNLHGLSYAGVVFATWRVLSARSTHDLIHGYWSTAMTVPFFAKIKVPSGTGDGVPASKRLPNLRGGLTLPFDASGWVAKEVNAVTRLMPDDAEWTTFVMTKRKKWRGVAHDRLVNIGWYVDRLEGPQGFLSWSTTRGEATLKVMDLSYLTVEMVGEEPVQLVGKVKLSAGSTFWILDAYYVSNRAFIAEFARVKQMMEVRRRMGIVPDGGPLPGDDAGPGL
mmetsp:Transcript_11098/g.25444  ORF Transcript_11098/g.25444 Transcript_11098/m.25444 type:complete len:581 (-) Transcript_11098:95-1837(-)